MKRTLRMIFAFCLLILFSSRSGLAQNCSDGTINLGTLDAHWYYKNDNLKISFQLPEGWYYYDYMAQERKYLKVGSDYLKMSAELYAGGDGPILDLAQLKNMPYGYGPVMLSLARFEDTASLIVSPTERLDTAVSLRVYYADTTNVDPFLKLVAKKMNPAGADNPEIQDGKIGTLDYRYLKVPLMNKSGQTVENLIGARNFGCVNVLIRISYITATGRSQIFDACRDLKLSQ
jgi:hypothetical protein